MTFEGGHTYYGEIEGQHWTIDGPVVTLPDGYNAMVVFCWVYRYVAVIDKDDPTRATVLLEDGSTTMYDKEVEK